MTDESPNKNNSNLVLKLIAPAAIAMVPCIISAIIGYVSTTSTLNAQLKANGHRMNTVEGTIGTLREQILKLTSAEDKRIETMVEAQLKKQRLEDIQKEAEEFREVEAEIAKLQRELRAEREKEIANLARMIDHKIEIANLNALRSANK